MPVTITTITASTRNYVEIFFRRKWFFLTPTLLIAGLAVAYSFTIPPKYMSSAVVLVEEEKVSNPLISGLAVSTSVQERLQTIVKILLSRPLLEQVISELNLNAGIKDALALEDFIESLRRNISVQMVGKDILKVSAEDRDPETCQRITNAITSLFIKHNLELQMRETTAGIEFLKSQKEIYEKKLKDSEKALREFKEKYQELLSVKASEEINKLIGQPSSGAPLINTEILKYTEYKGDLIRLNQDLKEAMNRKEQLEKQLRGEEEYVVSERILDPVVKQLESDMANKQVELAQLTVYSTEEHPHVIRLKKEIEELKEAIKQKRTRVAHTSDKEVMNPVYQDLKKELAKTEQNIEAIKTRIKLTEIYLQEDAEKIAGIPKKEEELANLQRDYTINSRIYAELTEKLETAYITQRLEFQEKGTKFRVVEPAKVPLKPFKPNRKFMALSGALLGMIVGAGLVLLAEMTDHSFTDINQLRNFLNIPVLAYVSQMLTQAQVREMRARMRFWLLVLLTFISFAILGAVVKYLIFKRG